MKADLFTNCEKESIALYITLLRRMVAMAILARLMAAAMAAMFIPICKVSEAGKEVESDSG